MMKCNELTSQDLVDFIHCRTPACGESRILEHLTHCSRCGNALQDLAATEAEWLEVQGVLQGVSKQRDLPSDEPRESHSFGTRQVLDSLLPTDFPDSLGRIGTFEIRSIIGFGSMGIVLKAYDRSLDRIVAIKVMSPALASSGVARQRFAREAKAAAAIQHTNVIAIHSVDDHLGLPYLVMPYVKGESLQRRIDKYGPLTLAATLRITLQIASGLVAAHRQGVIHRDIKPSNILLEAGVETAMIADFGLAMAIDDATMTRSGTIAGTPEYMSPEQARGETLDVSSDMFSLGSVLYFMCTGRPPFHARTTYGVIRQICEAEPTVPQELNPETPSWLAELITRLHHKSAAERPSAEQVRDWLEQCLAHVYHPTSKPVPLVPMPPEAVTPALSEYPNSHTSFVSFFTHGVVRMVITASLIAMALFSGYLIDERSKQQQQDGGSTVNAPTTLLKQNGRESDRTVFKTLTARFPNAEEVKSLSLDINRGSIEVVGHDAAEVQIEILNPQEKVDDLNASSRTMFSPQYDFRVDDDTNSISFDTYNQDYRLDLRVKVPVVCDVSVDTYYDGYLVVDNVTGSVNATSQNCNITLKRISGSAIASTYNGNIVADFTLLTTNAQLDFESYNGDLKIALPDDCSVLTAVSAGSGSYRTEFEIVGSENVDLTRFKRGKLIVEDGNYQLGTIHAGDIPLRIETTKGRVEIIKSSVTENFDSRPSDSGT